MIREALIYVREFRQKGLVSMPDCKRHYDHFSLDEIRNEAAWLLGDSLKALPFQLMFDRCFALFYEMVERSACAHYFTDEQRYQFIRLTIETKEKILSRCAQACRDDIRLLMSETCARVKTMGYYKKAADLVRDSNGGFSGPFAAKRKMVVHAGSRRMH